MRQTFLILLACSMAMPALAQPMGQPVMPSVASPAASMGAPSPAASSADSAGATNSEGKLLLGLDGRGDYRRPKADKPQNMAAVPAPKTANSPFGQSMMAGTPPAANNSGTLTQDIATLAGKAGDVMANAAQTLTAGGGTATAAAPVAVPTVIAANAPAAAPSPPPQLRNDMALFNNSMKKPDAAPATPPTQALVPATTAQPTASKLPATLPIYAPTGQP